MRETLELPMPSLSRGLFARVTAFTDEALFEQQGIRAAFIERSGGVSDGPYKSLNLSTEVGDTEESVAANRRMLCDAFGVGEGTCLVPRQVHGDTVLVVPGNAQERIGYFQRQADEGADGVLVETPGIAVLLCFADCIPVIIASPGGRFAVVHAGWRGVENGIAVKALSMIIEGDATEGLATDAAHCNIYIGPHIRACCFEAGEDVRRRFIEAFGISCAVGDDHIDLNRALRIGLIDAGVEEKRIADVGECTACGNDRFFSYRAQGGICGRHGAFASKI